MRQQQQIYRSLKKNLTILTVNEKATVKVKKRKLNNDQKFINYYQVSSYVTINLYYIFIIKIVNIENNQGTIKTVKKNIEITKKGQSQRRHIPFNC